MTSPEPTLEQLLGLDDAETSAKPNESGSALRKQLEAVLAENKAYKERVAKAEAAERARTAADLVTKHNVPAVFQPLLLKEIGDGELNDEAVTAFVATYGAGWGATAAEASTTPEQQAQTQAVQALQALGNGAQPGQVFSEEVVRGQMAQAQSAADVMRMVAEQTQGLQLLE